MKKYKKTLLLCCQGIICLSLVGCGGNNSPKEGSSSGSSQTSEDDSKPPYEDDSEEVNMEKAVKINCDFSKPSDPALIKKIDMYNAGCVNPVENYERDMEYSKRLNSNSLRIDASVGKDNGNAGEFIVSDDYEIYDYNEKDGSYKVDISSLKYDFSELDKTLGYFKEMDTLPYVSWCYIPAPLQYNSKFTRLDTNITNWREAFEEIYYQYAKHCVDTNTRIGYNEIYNEPDLEILKYFGVFDDDTTCFLDLDNFAPLESDGKTRNPAKGVYPDFYEYGSKGILRANPDATVGGPAFALGEIGVADWVGFFPRVIERNLQLDFYSFHSYLDGETWYLPDEKRAAGSKNELETVVDGLEGNSHFLKTSLHINEYSPINGDNGLYAGDNADYNFYYGAEETLDAIFEVADRSSVQLVNWAQMMSCSTSSNDPYGLIDRQGNPKAAYNAVLLYQDMPVWRYTSNVSDPSSGLRSVVSSDDDKISILLWNENSARDDMGLDTTAGDREAAVSIASPKFKGGTRKVYRIDKTHASSGDKTATMLPSAQNKVELNGNEDYVWKGNVPAQGVVYITIEKDDLEDFTVDNSNESFANTIKKQYWYEDRYRGLTGSREEYSDYVDDLSGSYAMFDDHTWTAYLGLGSCAGKADGSCKNQAVASCAVICDDLPTNFTVCLEKDGKIKALNQYSNLSVRIDFYDDEAGAYTNSVTLHNGVYDISAKPNEQDSKLSTLSDYPWGTEKLADDEVQYEGDTWEVNLQTIAPSSWLKGSRKAQISYTLRNTGANSRCAIQLMK